MLDAADAEAEPVTAFLRDLALGEPSDRPQLRLRMLRRLRLL